MTDINDLVQEFSTTSLPVANDAVGAMGRLHAILKQCFDYLEVCFDIISFFVTAVDLADKNLQMFTNNASWQGCTESLDDLISLKAKFKILLDGYRKMINQSFSIFKELGDILRSLPGVVVQRDLNLQFKGMDLYKVYKVKPNFLERVIKLKSAFEPLISPNPSGPNPGYRLDDYLFDFLQDRDLYYCDPMLQHISICHLFFSFLYGSNAFDHQP